MRPEDTPCACTTLRKASRAVTRFYDDALRSQKLTTTQFAVLRAVAREGRIPMSHLAETMVMDRTTFYRAVGPLLRDGDLQSVDSDSDGRAKLLQLSPAGKRRMARAARQWAGAQRKIVERMGLDRWKELSRWLAEATAHAMALYPLETEPSAASRGRAR